MLYDPKRNRQTAYFFDTTLNNASTPAPAAKLSMTHHRTESSSGAKSKSQAKKVSCIDMIWEETNKGDRTLIAIGKV